MSPVTQGWTWISLPWPPPPTTTLFLYLHSYPHRGEATFLSTPEWYCISPLGSNSRAILKWGFWWSLTETFSPRSIPSVAGRQESQVAHLWCQSVHVISASCVRRRLIGWLTCLWLNRLGLKATQQHTWISRSPSPCLLTEATGPPCGLPFERMCRSVSGVVLEWLWIMPSTFHTGLPLSSQWTPRP